jgi:hypothetical protein
MPIKPYPNDNTLVHVVTEQHEILFSLESNQHDYSIVILPIHPNDKILDIGRFTIDSTENEINQSIAEYIKKNPALANAHISNQDVVVLSQHFKNVILELAKMKLDLLYLKSGRHN